MVPFREGFGVADSSSVKKATDGILKQLFLVHKPPIFSEGLIKHSILQVYLNNVDK